MTSRPATTNVSFSVPPPDASDRYVPILSPQPGIPSRFLILGHAVLGCLVHWVSDERMKGGGRTVPHTTPDDTCPVCVSRNQKPRWHGYLACWWEHSSRYVLADLTVHAVQTCPSLVPASGLDLRGMSLLLRRIGKSRNSPVSAELVQAKRDEKTLAADFDVSAALMRLWGETSARNWRIDDLEGRE